MLTNQRILVNFKKRKIYQSVVLALSKRRREKVQISPDILVKIDERLSHIESRLTSLEESRRQSVSPPRRPGQAAFESLGGLTKITPAMELTLEAVKGLTVDSKLWVTVEEIAEKTGRSMSTESAYTKTLSKVGAVARKPVYKGTGEDRRVRKYVYRSKR